MLLLPVYDQINDITLFRDSDQRHVFFALPNLPRLRYGPDGRPVFTFLKYKRPVDRAPGTPAGGGYVQFDVEFTIPAAQKKQVRDVLQDRVNREARAAGQQPPEVVLGVPQWTDGTVQLVTMKEGGGMIDKIIGVGKPSLMGSNIAAFALELTQDGAALMWQAFQMATLPVAVNYQLKFLARIPAIEMRVWLHASQLVSKWEQIDRDESMWHDDSFTQQRRELFAKSQIGNVQIVDWPNFGGGADDNFKKQVIDWGWQLLEDHVKDELADKLGPITDGGEVDGMEHVTRDIVVQRVTDLDVYFKRDSVVQWSINPNATLQGFLDTPGPNGTKPNRADFFKEVDLDDPFFRELQVRIHCNADFKNDPIHSVQVDLTYGEATKGYVFTDGAQVEVFKANLKPELGPAYHYSGKVNYTGQSKSLPLGDKQERTSELVLDVGSLGCLAVDATAGDIDWTNIDQVQVHITYADAAHGVAEESTVLVLRDGEKTQHYKRLLFAPLSRPYQWGVTYFLKTGQQIARTGTETSPTLIVNDVFTERLVATFVPAGSFSRMDRISVDVEYADPANDYRVPRQFNLQAADDAPIFSVPLWDKGPRKFRYRYRVSYKDGHGEDHDWADHDGSGTIAVGEVFAAFVTVDVVSDLLDFAQVRLVRLSLHYDDEAGQVHEADDFVFSKDRKPANLPWKIGIKNPQLRQYTMKADYFMTDHTVRTVGPQQVADESIVLDLPAA